MHCIQNSCIGKPSLFNKAIGGFTCLLALTVIALSIIGLAATPSESFKAIVQFGAATNGVLLGASIFVLTLDLVWIAALCKKTKMQLELGLPHSEPVQYEPSQSALISTSEEINDTYSLNQLPEEIILEIFSCLSATELAKCGGVSRKWRRLTSDPVLWNAFDLRKISPLLKIFDESDWAAHVDLSSFGLDVTDAPPLDKRTAIPTLKRCLASLPIEENRGVTLLTIPKGLTLNMLVKLVGSPKMGNASKFKKDGNFSECGDIAVDKTYRIVITNNVFEKSRNLPVGMQQALVSKIGCEMPTILEAAALLALTFMSSGKRLYNDNPWTYTRCSEQISGFQLVVGCFSLHGIHIYRSYYAGHSAYGVGGVLRKF